MGTLRGKAEFVGSVKVGGVLSPDRKHDKQCSENGERKTRHRILLGAVGFADAAVHHLS